jgi:TonB family protein
MEGSMERVCLEKNCFTKLRKPAMKLLPAIVFALMVAMAMPAMAADRAIKSRVSPAYPEIARRMKINGVVVISATVDAQGNVTDVKATSGNRMLSVAAEDAVRRWKFVPAASETTEIVDINFSGQ